MRPAPILAILLAVGAAPGAAQAPGAVEFAALGVWHNKTTTMDALRGFGAGARLGVWLPGGFELEGQLDFTAPRNWAVDNRFQLFHLAGSLLYNIPVGNGSVYLRGGYGKLLQKNCVFGTVECSSHGAATGAAGFRVPMSASVQFRAEAMVRTRPAYDYTSFGASAGFAILKRETSPRNVVDTDFDGVADGRDRCPRTQPGALVDSRGCPTDLDADGVPDGIDRCPGTPRGTPVDPVGCPARRDD